MRPLLLLAVLAVAGCGTSAETREPSDPDVVEGDDIERRDIQRVENMLRGQVAGVRVEQRGNGLAIRIRGTSTFGNTDPLFVIDGLPITLGAEGALEGINPRDIASIRVLKNVSDTAIYGSRGANGVVLITTVRPGPPDDAEEPGDS